MERETGTEDGTGKKAEIGTGERLKKRQESGRETGRGTARQCKMEWGLKERPKDRLGWRRLVERWWRGWQIKLRLRLALRAWSLTTEVKRTLESL